ncbi:MAG: TolC family protein [Balneolaceae bacterium]
MSLLFTLFLLFQPAEADSSLPVLELDQAIEIGLEQNYGIRIERESVAMAENNRKLGNAGFLPSVELTGSRTESIENSRFELSGNPPESRENRGATSTNSAAGVELTWTVFDGMRMFVSYERLGELEELSQVLLQSRVEETVQQIIQAYAHTVRIANQLNVFQELIDVTRERIGITETMRDLGSGSEYALLEARTDLNADKAQLMQEQNRLQEAKIQLIEWMGIDQDLQFSVSDELPVNEGLQYNTIRAHAFQENSQLHMIRIEQRISDLELQEVQRERWPELELQSGYQYNRTDGGGGFMRFNETDGFMIGLTARINLFDGFEMNRRIQNAKIEQKSRQLQLQEENLRLEFALLRAWESYQNSLNLVRLELNNLDNADERMEIALERFREGMISALEFREAQRVYLNAESRLIEARYRAKVAETELLRLGGSLTEIGI